MPKIKLTPDYAFHARRRELERQAGLDRNDAAARWLAAADPSEAKARLQRTNQTRGQRRGTQTHGARQRGNGARRVSSEVTAP